MPVAMFD